MNWLDVVLLLLIGLSVFGSFKKGLSRQVIHLAAVVLGILLGAWFYGRVAEYLEPHVSSPMAAKLGGFLMVFFAVVLLGAIVSSIVGKFLRVTGLSIVDHLLGAGFGLLRGLLVAVQVISYSSSTASNSSAGARVGFTRNAETSRPRPSDFSVRICNAVCSKVVLPVPTGPATTVKPLRWRTP